MEASPIHRSVFVSIVCEMQKKMSIIEIERGRLFTDTVDQDKANHLLEHLSRTAMMMGYDMEQKDGKVVFTRCNI